MKFRQPIRSRYSRYIWAVAAAVLLLIIFMSRRPGTEEEERGFGICAFITTNHRPGAFYLNDVVASIIDQPNIQIIVYNGDIGDTHRHFFEKFSYWDRTIVKQREESVRQYTGISLKTDIHKTREYKIAKDDDPKRKMWRTKECFDFVQAAHYAMKYCGGDKTEWYLFLEDDTVWTSTKDILQVLNPDESIWQYFLADYTGAVLFRRVMLESFIGYAQPRCDLIPIDWLMDTHAKSLGIIPTKKRLFRDIGKVSTKDALSLG